jgi:hypothetical protein
LDTENNQHRRQLAKLKKEKELLMEQVRRTTNENNGVKNSIEAQKSVI